MVTLQDERVEPLVPPSLQLDGWRVAPAVRSANSVDSTRMLLPDEYRCTNSLAVSSLGEALVVGSAGRDKNLFVVRTPDATETRKFSLFTALSAPGPVHSLAWSGNTLLAGSIDGTVNVYDVDQGRFFGGDGATNGAISYYGQAVQRPSKASMTTSGSHVQTMRVQNVAFAASEDPLASAGQFAFTVGPSVSLWDVNRLDAPVRTDKVAPDVNFALAWHPQPAYQLIITGGADRSVTMLDPRKQGKPIIWKSRNVHEGIIRDVAWHPYVSYWLASASDDGTVQLHDARYNARPLYAIRDHYSAVNAVVWSNSHCDMLATASQDRRFRLWRLKSEKSESGPREVSTDLTIETSPLFDSSVVRAVSSKTMPDTYYALSALGELPHDSYDERDYPVEFSIETSVYARDLDTGHRQVAAWIKRPGNDQRMQEAKTFLELLVPKPPIDPSTWAIPPPSSGRRPSSASEAAEGFPRELARRAWFLPPGFDMRFAKQASKDAKEELDMMLVKINLRDYIQRGDVERLLSLESTIIKVLSLDSRALDSSLIKDMLKVVMKSDRIRGLRFGLALLECRSARTSTLASVVHLLLFPTVFEPANDSASDGVDSPAAVSPRDSVRSPVDSGARQTRRDERRLVLRHMEEIVSDPKTAAAMIQVEIELQKLHQKTGDPRPGDLVHLLRGHRTVSANANRLFVNALAGLELYDEYFEAALRLIAEYARFPFARTLLHQLAVEVAPRCKEDLSSISAAARENPRSISVKDYRSSALMCMRIIMLPGSEIPGLNRKSLTQHLVEILAGMCELLNILVNERKDYSQAARESQQIMRGIKEAAGGSQNIPDEVRRQLEMMQQFTRV
ncbi:WD40-repeat-containing domain protein [Thamnocephalis sphaerospora]|uniref:WD40-repeat-containing domain protein n=1 Tax=Thamnocephalis sphaerospora TaxID=78915 RepID=A0A4P9XVE5_9FUNG|nr:WD40-repeat-containing domain protein [Thamnocephalis sphaerospora]|eukprot:RKP10245.1 WD40-repeat-containing domain protein [Thamnocephalis sphaerospora]